MVNKFTIASAKAAKTLQAYKAAAHGTALPVSATATGIKIGAHSISMEWLVFGASLLIFGPIIVKRILEIWNEHRKWKEAVDTFIWRTLRPSLEFIRLHGGPTREFEEGVVELLKAIKYNQKALAALEKALLGYGKGFRSFVWAIYGRRPVPDDKEE